MNGLPVAAAVSEVLSLFKQRFHQRTANAGMAVSVDSVGEPRTRNADLSGVAALEQSAPERLVVPLRRSVSVVLLGFTVLLFVAMPWLAAEARPLLVQQLSGF